jgi:hypothetical protein
MKSKLERLIPVAKRLVKKKICRRLTKIKITLGAGIMPLLSVGCGTDSSQSVLSSAPTETAVPTTIFAYSGNNSCKEGSDSRDTPVASDVYIALKKYLNSVEYEFKDPRVDYLVSCYDFGSDTISYVTSWDDQIIYNVDEQEVRDLTLEQLDNKPDDKFVMIGHSYGGWLAMDSVKDFQDSQQVEQLITLDPISKRQCSWSTPSGCLQAPLDILSGMRTRINDLSTDWTNLYQTESMFVHSSAIPQADRNTRKILTHTQIDNSTETWQDIAELVTPILTRTEIIH